LTHSSRALQLHLARALPPPWEMEQIKKPSRNRTGFGLGTMPKSKELKGGENPLEEKERDLRKRPGVRGKTSERHNEGHTCKT